MPTVYPIQCFRPAKHFARKFIRKPSDFDSPGREEVLQKLLQKSVYSISQPELFGHSFEEAKDFFSDFLRQGLLVPDTEPNFFLYEIEYKKQRQIGLVCCQLLEDIQNNKLLFHEQTKSKNARFIEERIANLGLNFTPVYSIAPDEDNTFRHCLESVTEKLAAELSVETTNDIIHRIYKVDNLEYRQSITECVQSIPITYLADGHHRLTVRKKLSPDHSESRFPNIIFPSGMVQPGSYAKIIREFTDQEITSFLEETSNIFGHSGTEKQEKAEIFHNGKWRTVYSTENTISFYRQFNQILEHSLHLTNQDEDDRILFLKDIYGRESIANFTEKTESQLAIRFQPLQVQDVFQAATHKTNLPPKSTLFYPKPRAGLFITRM